MKLPKFQYTTSPSTSRAQVTPVLRSAPTMVTPVLRNPQAYMRDPRAGQRNVQLEAQAVLDQAKPMQAAITGLLQVGEVLAKADLEEKVANATLDFKQKGETALSDMKDSPIGNTYTTEDFLTGSVITQYDPTHEKSFLVFQTRVMSDRDAIAETLPLGGRAAFIRGTNAYTSQLLTEAAAVNQKQHVEYLKGGALRALNKSDTPGAVEDWASQDWVNIVLGGEEVEKQRQKRLDSLAVDHFAFRIQKLDPEAAETEIALQRIETELRTGNQEISVTTVDGQETVELYPSEFAPYLNSENQGKLLDAITKVRDRINKIDAEKRTEFLRTTNAAVLENWRNFNEESFRKMLDDGSVDTAGYDRLLKAWQNAKSEPITPNDSTFLAMKADIASYPDDVILSRTDITNDQKSTLLGLRNTYDQGLLDWSSKTNTAGPQGYYALDRLKRFHNVSGMDVQNVFLNSSQMKEIKKTENEQAFDEDYTELVDLMLSDTYTPEQKPKAALDFVNQKIAERTAAKNQDTTERDPAKDVALATAIGQLTGNKFNSSTVVNMPPGEEREALVKGLNERGLPIPEFKKEDGETDPDEATSKPWWKVWQ